MRHLGLIFAFAGTIVAAGEWRTFSGDAQRTGWAKDEKVLNKSNVSKLKLEWSSTLEVAPMDMWSLAPPVFIKGLYGSTGVKDVIVVAGSSDVVYGVDADNGKILWNKKFAREGTPPNKGTGGWLCPNAQIATPYIDRASRNVYAIASDGKLHTFNVLNGEDTAPPLQFVPPFSKAWSLNMSGDGILYTVVSQGCSGPRNGVYGMNLKDPARPVAYYKTTGGIWGRAGAALGSNGRVYAEVGDGPFDPEAGRFADAFVALEPKSLKLADWYAPKNQAWIDKKDLDMGNISPTVFSFKGRELIAGSGKEGVIFLLDAKSLGGPDHRTPLHRSPAFTNPEANFHGRGFWGALTTWEDEKGVRWLYAPAYGPWNPASPAFPTTHGEAADGSIMAFRVEDRGGKPEVVPAWRSVNMVAPDPAIVANGVVFALATGDAVRQVDTAGGILSSKQRIAETRPAVLHAFDAETGKELFSSGDAIRSFVHFSGLAMGEGKVIAVSYDGKVYCFGLGQDQ